MLAVGNCCYVAVCSAAQGASARTGEERGGAHRGGRPPTARSVCRPSRVFVHSNDRLGGIMVLSLLELAYKS